MRRAGVKLGIAVVYMVFDGDEPLLDLHLRSIERHTEVPFTIYAATNRLAPEMKERLASKPFVERCPIPPTDLRGSRENAYYLERLISTAIEDGATHVVTLHVDSFPLRTGWATDLAAIVAGDCAFAAIVRDEERDRKPMTACLFFSRAFHDRYHPRLLFDPEAQRSTAGHRYAAGLVNPDESGTGYGYLASVEGLRWVPLRRSNAAEDHYYYGSVHGDLVFHLGAAGHALRTFPGSKEHARWLRLRQRAVSRLPRAGRRLLRAVTPDRLLFPESTAHQRAYAMVRDALLADPDGYLEYLRTGRRVGGSSDIPSLTRTS